MLSITDVRKLYLGVQGENGGQTIEIDVKPWLVAYPNAAISIWHKRPGARTPEPTGATLDSEAGTLIWEPTNTDTFVDGEGEAEIRLYDNGIIKKTRTVITGVSPSITGASGETLGSDWQSYITYIESLKNGAISAKNDAAASATAAAASATAAEGSATTAATKAGEAAASATAAAGSASTASTKAGEAAASATAAAGSATQAATSASQAAASKTAAETAQGKAETAQEAAEDAQEAAETAQEKAEDAQEAAEEAQAAAESAQTAAEDSETAAAASESAAAGSATTASTKAGEAAASATAAAASATAAATAKTAAETAQGKAEDAQTAAETAQTAAETAQGKAEDAQEAAEAAQTAAEAAQEAAEEVLESIPEDYSEMSEDVANLKTDKADIDGTHEDLTAGNALFLLSDRGETDNEPYAFRKTGGSKNAYGREMLKKVIGGTIAWNQLQRNGNFASSDNLKAQSGGSQLTVSNGVATVKHISGNLTAYNPALGFNTLIKGVENHVYYVSVEVNSPVNGGLYFGGNTAIGGFPIARFPVVANQWVKLDVIKKISALTSSGDLFAYIGMNNAAEMSEGSEISFKKIAIYDLTQMFGSTIADAIDAMEQATAGAGVAWFRSLFPKSYYAYDAGTLMSVNAESHKLTGFNQWDEETRNGYYDSSTGAFVSQSSTLANKNMIPVTPNTTYYCKSGTYHVNTVYFDKSMNFIGGGYHKENTTFTTPANCYFLGFSNDFGSGTTYNNDICINLSDTAKNGTYEPYESRSYPLANVELRGVPKWENGQLVFDGDEYTPDGTVKRRYALVQVDATGLSNNGHNDESSTFRVLWHRQNGVYTKNVICDKYFQEYKSGMDAPYMNIRTSSDGVEFTLKYNMINVSAGDDDGTVKLPAAKTWFTNNPIYVVYELATPTTESADPYRELQISNRNGTEEFTDRAEEAGTRDVAIPVGTETFYPVDVFALIDALQAQINS